MLLFFVGEKICHKNLLSQFFFLNMWSRKNTKKKENWRGPQGLPFVEKFKCFSFSSTKEHCFFSWNWEKTDSSLPRYSWHILFLIFRWILLCSRWSFKIFLFMIREANKLLLVILICELCYCILWRWQLFFLWEKLFLFFFLSFWVLLLFEMAATFCRSKGPGLCPVFFFVFFLHPGFLWFFQK